MQTIKQLILCLYVGFTLMGCIKDDPNPSIEVSNTVLAYIAADNSLSEYASMNIDQMVKGMANCYHKANMLVYVDDLKTPRLYLIKKETKGQVSKTIVREYDEHNSASKEVMRSVIEDVFNEYPAKHKGLLLWSHGLNWFPIGYYGNNYFAPSRKELSGVRRSFGQDFIKGKSMEMDINDVVDAIPDIDLDFIAFDACYMGSVEVAYALRHKAKQLIAAPTEIMAGGFPYSDIMYYMLTGAPQTKQIAQSFYNYYNQQSGVNRSASISVLNLAAMDRLADWTRNNLPYLNDSIDPFELQHFDRFSQRYQFDFRHLYRIGLSGMDAERKMVELDSILIDLVEFKANTPYFICQEDGTPYSQGFPILYFSGISTYYEVSTYKYLNAAYKNTEWYKATR